MTMFKNIESGRLVQLEPCQQEEFWENNNPKDWVVVALRTDGKTYTFEEL